MKNQKAAAITAAFSFSEPNLVPDRTMMKRLSLKSFCYPLLTFTVYLISSFFSFVPNGTGADIAPHKDIIVVGEESREPEWKRMWDDGRAHTRNLEYEKAIPFYKKVLKQKPNIEEVKWELCRVYMEIQKYDEASLLLDSLLEVNGNRTEYLLSAGNIALMKQKESQAVLFFGQVLEQNPEGIYYIQALKGFIQALVGQDKMKLAIPLMEQLYQSGGESPDLLLNLAQSLSKAGELEKASYYYQELINKYRVSHEVIHQAAYIYEQQEEIDAAAVLWERYLTEAPESLYLRQKLAEYYLVREKYQEALPHLIILLDNNVNREEYLLQTGKIYLLTFGRADKALGYYESYNNEFPQGENVSSEIENIRIILANNLLSIVENNGVWMLWTDLAKITPDRVGIYLAMADLLEGLGKNKELLEVLQIINVHRPDDLQIRLKLSSLYYKSNSYQRCLNTLNAIRENDNLSTQYYMLRMECERALKNDTALMTSYLSYLDKFPKDEGLRTEAIQLGGAIGDLKAVRKLLAGYKNRGQTSLASDRTIYKAGSDALIVNQFYTEADKLVSDILEKKQIDPESYNLFSRESARIYYLQGRKFTAEQQLRVLLFKSWDDLNIIFDLVGNAIKNEDVESALVWLSMAGEKLSLEKSAIEQTDNRSLYLYYKYKIHQLSGDADLMRKEAHAYLDSLDLKRAPSRYDLKIFMLLVDDYYQNQSYKLYTAAITRYSHYFTNNGIAPTLSLLVNPPKENDLSVSWDTIFMENSSAELFDIYELLLLLGETVPADILLDHLNSRLQGSVRLEISRVKLYLEQNLYDKAVQGYLVLAERYPDEKYFYDEVKRIQGYRGEGISETSLAGVTYESRNDETEIHSDQKKKYSTGQQLETARTLWLSDNESESLKVYEDLESSLRNQLHPVLEQVKHFPDYTSISQDSFWNKLLNSKDDIEILDHVMDSSFFASHLSDEVSQNTAEAYENYRWLKIVYKERKAKQALNQREFYQAEKRYQELLEEEDVENVNVYTDLATVYNRLGRYAKETELLEKIKEQQFSYPPLQTVAEKNENRRRPQLYTGVLFREEDGRNGDIDIKQQYVGLGLRIQPTLYQEAGFQAGRNSYGNSEDSSVLKSNMLSVQYAYLFGNDAELNAKIGFEDISEVGNAYYFYNLMLSGSLAESLKGYLSADQSLVSDTIKSLSEGIYRREYKGGLTFDYIPRIFIGMDFTYRDYNDDNDGKRIHLWSSYRIFSDLNNFDITYDYEKLENQIDSDEKSLFDGELVGDDLGYWSPGSYWKHSLTAKVKKELWPPGKRQSGTSFVSAHYGIGYEAGDNFIQQLKLDILLEISTPFLLKGTFVADWSDDYDRTKAFASFVYRW